MPLNTFILLATLGISILGFSNPQVQNRLIFSAFAIKHYREWYRFFSHGLLHANVIHLAFNMLALYSFGSLVEQVFVGRFGTLLGEGAYLLLYVGALLASSLVDYKKYQDQSWYRALGASGAVSAVMYASILIHPNGGIYMFFIPIAIPAWIFGIFYLIYSSYMAKKQADNIGHDAHFWGAVYGFLLTWMLIPQLMPRFLQTIFSFFSGGFGG
jgi:membrane associated rhomboid family serine protease